MNDPRIPKIAQYHLLGATPEDIERVMNSLEPKAIKVLEGVEFNVMLDPFLGNDEVYIMRAPFGGMSRLSPTPAPQPPRHRRISSGANHKQRSEGWKKQTFSQWVLMSAKYAA